MDLNREESSLKDSLLRLMKTHRKTIYRRDGIEIRLVPGEETVKVRIRPVRESIDEVEVDEVAGEEAELDESGEGEDEHGIEGDESLDQA